MLRYEHTIDRLSRLPDDQRADGIEPDRTIWQTTDGNDVPVEDEDSPEPALTEPDPETDSLVARYFGDVRQFGLLTRAEEKALWQRIADTATPLRHSRDRLVRTADCKWPSHGCFPRDRLPPN